MKNKLPAPGVETAAPLEGPQQEKWALILPEGVSALEARSLTTGRLLSDADCFQWVKAVDVSASRTEPGWTALAAADLRQRATHLRKRNRSGDYSRAHLFDELAHDIELGRLAAPSDWIAPAGPETAAPRDQASGEPSTVTRFEVIDNWGRTYVQHGCTIELSYQDHGRTLKVFVGAAASVPSPPAQEPIVWANDATPITGPEVLALLNENERLRRDLNASEDQIERIAKALPPPPPVVEGTFACPICGFEGIHAHGDGDVFDWLDAQASRFGYRLVRRKWGLRHDDDREGATYRVDHCLKRLGDADFRDFMATPMGRYFAEVLRQVRPIVEQSELLALPPAACGAASQEPT